MIFVPVASPSTSVSTTFGGVFDVAASEQRLAAIETELSRPNAWDNPEALTPLLREKRQLEDEVSRLNALKTCHDDMHEWLELAVESGEDEALESLAKQQDSLDALLDETELVMLLSGEESIREVIAFPMNKSAQDVMMDAPSKVTEAQLKELHIAVTEEE